jgi:adenylate cyclase class 2
MSLRRNIEFKARLTDFVAAEAIALEVATHRQGTERQVDTYFKVPQGRLKLREIEGRGAWLIGYARPNDDACRESAYRLVKIADAAGLRATLATALGELVCVRKVREIYLHHNVRIHLDRVEELGEFLEFEAVLGAGEDEGVSQQRLDTLIEKFTPTLGEAIAGSYSDLLMRVVH